jgi:hypothetical protein
MHILRLISPSHYPNWITGIISWEPDKGQNFWARGTSYTQSAKTKKPFENRRGKRKHRIESSISSVCLGLCHLQVAHVFNGLERFTYSSLRLAGGM